MTVKMVNDFVHDKNTRTYRKDEILECENLYNGILRIKVDDYKKDYILKQAVEVVTNEIICC